MFDSFRETSLLRFGCADALLDLIGRCARRESSAWAAVVAVSGIVGENFCGCLGSKATRKVGWEHWRG
jgi:hypothetical protein